MEGFILQFFGLMESIKNVLVGITHEEIGYISTVCLGLCAVPLLYKTIKDGHCKGVSGLFIFFWLIGEILGTVYVVPLAKLPLIINYGFNVITVSIIFIYKIRKG